MVYSKQFYLEQLNRNNYFDNQSVIFLILTVSFGVVD